MSKETSKTRRYDIKKEQNQIKSRSMNNQQDEKKNLYIYGRHEVLEALKSDKLPEIIYISSTAQGSIIKEIRDYAKEKLVKVVILKEDVFRKKFGIKKQGVVAKAGLYRYKTVEEILSSVKNIEQNGKIILVALNHVEDCRNLGAIIRTTEAAGANGLIIPLFKSAYVNEWAIKTAQGAHNWLQIARVKSLVKTIQFLKENNFKVYGLCERAPKSYKEVRYSNRSLLVVGGEDVGLGKEIPKLCDEVVRINLRGKTPSLNVSVALGVILFEIINS